MSFRPRQGEMPGAFFSSAPEQFPRPACRGRNPILPEIMRPYYGVIGPELFHEGRHNLPSYTFENFEVLGPGIQFLKFRFEDMSRMDMHTPEIKKAVRDETRRRELFLSRLHQYRRDAAQLCAEPVLSGSAR
mgnify:FL=1|tara:strand:- start:1559 stop:1954 length:396 start_codon:yes stop_codon:yes gene_type:complete